jgi:hypothetical protein
MHPDAYRITKNLKYNFSVEYPLFGSFDLMNNHSILLELQLFSLININDCFVIVYFWHQN